MLVFRGKVNKTTNKMARETSTTTSLIVFSINLCCVFFCFGTWLHFNSIFQAYWRGSKSQIIESNFSRKRKSHKCKKSSFDIDCLDIRRQCVFLCVLCFALFNQIVQILVNKLWILRKGKGDPHIKRYFFVLNTHRYFFCV